MAAFVDLFAGGGGASHGITKALGKEPCLAINHNPIALDMHEANHPATQHLIEDITQVAPTSVLKGRDIAGLWLSPSCTDHTNAGGKKPLRDSVRGLPWMGHTWAKARRPAVIYLENVVEMMDWGPLRADGRPDPERKGEHWRRFLDGMKDLGYEVEHRILQAHRYGVPTIRERLFMVMRSDGHKIVWPQATHGEGLKPYRSAFEIIDWGNPVRSIFDRKRPLAESTEERIAHGVIKHVLNAEQPFLCDGGIEGAPDGTVRAAFIAKHFTGNRGISLRQPLGTVTTKDHHSLVEVKLRKGESTEGRRCAAFIMKYYRDGGQWQSMRDPLHTIRTKSHLALVCVQLEGYEIVDIGMRMLAPNELFAAQGFDADYNYQVGASGRKFTQAEQIFCCGNSVPPSMAELLVSHNKPVI